jgi:hypothetical protein
MLGKKQLFKGAYFTITKGTIESRKHKKAGCLHNRPKQLPVKKLVFQQSLNLIHYSFYRVILTAFI